MACATVVVVIYRGMVEEVIADQDVKVLILDLYDYDGDEKPREWEVEVNAEAVQECVQEAQAAMED